MPSKLTRSNTPKHAENALQRERALQLRLDAASLERDSGMRIGPDTLTIFAQVMHLAAERASPVRVRARNVSWEKVAQKLGTSHTADQLRKMWRVFEWLTDDAPDRLDEVYGVVTAEDSNGAKRRRIVSLVASMIDEIHTPVIQRQLATNKRPLVLRGLIANRLINDLADVAPCFAALDPSYVFDQLSLAKPPSNLTRRGGAGVVLPTRCAARLSRKAKFLGDDKVSETAAKGRFSDAPK